MIADAFSPVNILEQGAQMAKGEQSRMSSICGALAVADLVKTSLGPKGMDKILQSSDRGGNVSVTNDGATILKSVLIDNPAAKVLIEISKVQDDEVGDGTTSVCVLAGACPLTPSTSLLPLYYLLLPLHHLFTTCLPPVYHLCTAPLLPLTALYCPLPPRPCTQSRFRAPTILYYISQASSSGRRRN